MKKSALERKLIVCLATLLATALPTLFTACGGGIIAPTNANQQNGTPVITSVVPDSAPLTGGKLVLVSGSNLTVSGKNTPPTVTFGGVAATQVTIVSATQVSAVVPAHAAGNVNVQVTNPDGKSGSAGKPFVYTPSSPTLAGISPNSGPIAGGTSVTISGSNFSQKATVAFGGTPAAGVSFVSSSQLTAVTPAHAAGKVDVTVTNSDGTDAVLSGGFTYLSPSSPTISGISPNSGPTAGGTVVTITGTNFASGDTVTFGGTAATGSSVVSSTQLMATTPAHAAGAVSVTVTNSNGESASLANGFTYGSTTVTVSSVSPNSGSTAGGTAVTITGANFASGATVSFGGTAATGVSFVSSSQLRATTPAHAAGAVSVTVTNSGGGSGSLAGGFTYVSATLPTVSSVSPNSGPTGGGTAVTITGTNFASGATVSFGGTAASGVSFVSSTQLKATTPAHAAGAVSVTVTNSNGGTGSLANGFTYGSTSVTVSSVSPNSGSTSGGTAVTITGTNFASGATVTFGGTAATGVSFVSLTQLKATTPAHAAGAVSVTVTNPNGGSGSLASGFTYGSTSLTVSSVSPISGPAAGGTQITITGTNFQSGVGVTFGGLAATSVTVTNSTTIQAVTPAHSAGSVSVTVTNSSGQSATLSSGYDYHSVSLTWSAPSSTPVAITGYDVYRSTASAGPFTKLNSTQVSGTTYMDSTVQGSTTYYYEVKSVDSSGVESSPDGPVQVTTGP